jgi:histidinol-phosphate aminotransferase
LNNTGHITLSKRIHGGPDSEGVPSYDFSSNANSVGTPDFILNAIHRSNFQYYPDPEYIELRQLLATRHQVDPERVLIAGSASEFIFRVSAYVARQSFGGKLNSPAKFWQPEYCYGDYQNAAVVWNLEGTKNIMEAKLIWLCDPSSPLGRPLANIQTLINSLGSEQIVILDLAYEPLRLEGHLALNQSQLDSVWQMWSPNKSLGVTGIRGAYIIAPLNSQKLIYELNAMASSWNLGAHGVAMLSTWADTRSEVWLNESLDTLRDWKVRQIDMCKQMDWVPLHSVGNFFCANPQKKNVSKFQSQLRSHGIKLRDTSSFGLTDHFRMAVMPPAIQDKLFDAVISIGRK